MTWNDQPAPPSTALKASDWLRILRRTIPLALLISGGLVLLATLRLLERPVFGTRRPWTPFVTQTVCKGALGLIGLRRDQIGKPMTGAGAMVANHASWLDIFALNAGSRVVFVSKAEVSGWPGIGMLARATGTLFISRTRGQAADHVAAIRDRLDDGQTLAFFPEGTSTDGHRVLPFKPTLFAALVGTDTWVQPVTLRYHAPSGTDARCYGWWGDMDFAPHMMATLALPRQGRIEVIYHAPVKPGENRKALAASLQKIVAQGLS